MNPSYRIDRVENGWVVKFINDNKTWVFTSRSALLIGLNLILPPEEKAEDSPLWRVYGVDIGRFTGV